MPNKRDKQIEKNKIQMDLLEYTYNTVIKARKVVTEPVDTSMHGNIYDSFYSDIAKLKITRDPTITNDVLLGAVNATELLAIAGITKPIIGGPNSPQQKLYKEQVAAAKGLFSEAYSPRGRGLGTSDVGEELGGGETGNVQMYKNTFSMPEYIYDPTKKKKENKELKAAAKKQYEDPFTYSFDKFSTGITEALTKKYSSLGDLQRGLLQNETATTEDDEQVVFSNNNAYQVQNEYSAMQKNFKQYVKDVNTEFTKYGQDMKKIGTYQTATMSEDMLYKKILSDIQASYNTFNAVQEQGYIAGSYMNPQTGNINTTSTNAYLASLPTTIVTP